MSTSVPNAREQAKKYLASHHIPQMFESLLSCLMLERPDDPVQYIETKMVQIKEVGLENVNWETFVFALHPYRDPVRLNHIRDGSKFDKERDIEEEAMGDKLNDQHKSSYQPEVFRLTEAQ